MATPGVYMDAIRRWIMDPNRAPNKVVAAAIEALLTKATTTETAADGHTTDITTLQTEVADLQTDVSDASNEAGLALALAAAPPSAVLPPHSFSWTGDATGSLVFDGTADVSAALTLATVNSNVGSFGTGTSVANFTTNAKGLITAASNVAITSAPKWTTARTLSFTGDATGSGSVDGSANVATALTLANTAVTAGTYGDATHTLTIAVDAKGRLTSVSANAISAGVTTTGSPASGNLAKFSGASTITSGDLSGDVTTSGTLAATIANSAVTLAKIANAAANTRFLGSGSAGAGAAYAEQTIGAGTGISITAAASGITIAATGASIPTSGLIAPQGRLSLVTGVPVMISDQTAKSHVYYTPYIGPTIPVYSGSAWGLQVLSSDLDMALDTTNQTSGNLYDLFGWLNSGVLSIGAGPAWSSSTSRGTGAGTTELQMFNGIWTNKNSITLKNGAGSGTSGIAANTATYLGTVYATANGQTGMAYIPAAASGGTNNILGVYNAYNRLRVDALCRDSKASWTYNSVTWRPSDGGSSNTANRISWVDGLQQSPVQVLFQEEIGPNVSGADIGTSLDSTTNAPSSTGENYAGSTAAGGSIAVADAFAPQIGFHYAQAMEASVGNLTSTFFGAAATPTRQAHALRLSLDM